VDRKEREGLSRGKVEARSECCDEEASAGAAMTLRKRIKRRKQKAKYWYLPTLFR